MTYNSDRPRRAQGPWLQKPSPEQLRALQNILQRLAAEIFAATEMDAPPEEAGAAHEALLALIDELEVADFDVDWHRWFAKGVSFGTIFAQYRAAYAILKGRLSADIDTLAFDVLRLLHACADEMAQRRKAWSAWHHGH